MTNLPVLIPVLSKGKIIFYIERKKNDTRPSATIVTEYKLNLINSKIQLQKNEQKNKLHNQY